jgi:hypothetical protein
MVWVVGFKNASGLNVSAKVLASVTVAKRTDIPFKCFNCFATDPPYVSTSKTHIYVLDGKSTVSMLSPDGSLKKVASIPGTDNTRAAFAISPDDSLIAVGLMDFSSLTTKLYVERLGGGGRVDVFSAPGPYFYWPVRWRNGKIVLATGPNSESFANPYHGTGYALIDPIAGAQPVALGSGDCIPSGTVTAAGTACIVRPGTLCLEDLVANAVSPYYYNSCLRSLSWSGSETTFLMPNNEATTTLKVNYAALSPDGQEIVTDQLGKVFAPVSPVHGGNNFVGINLVLGLKQPARPCMGFINNNLLSWTFVNPDGSSDVRLMGATFEGSTDIAAGVPSSPVNGDLVGTVPDEFDR